jgi:uncharacterized membrane protein YfcA
MQLPYATLGFGVGMLVGLTGVGGGSLMTPLLVLLFGIHPATAVGTDLLFAAATKTAGTAMHGFNRTVDWRITARLACGSLPTTAVTLFVFSRFDEADDNVRRIITGVLFVALLLTATSLLFRRQLIEFASRRLGSPPLRTVELTVLTGAVLGVLVSLSSIGAGAIGIVALLLLYPNVPLARIVGSDIAHAVPLTLLAGFGHWMSGSVDLTLLGSLLTGSLPGILIGSFLTARVPEGLLRAVLAATLLVVASKMIF